MPYALRIFESSQRQTLRSITIDGVPWFVFADVCRSVGLKPNNGSFWKHLRHVDDRDHRLVARVDIENTPSTDLGEGGLSDPGGTDRLICINESGVYATVFRSRAAGAQDFQRWVTSDVLPSIRKTGSYSAEPSASLAHWKPFHDRISLTLTKVPEGYFCIFKEMADLTAQLITQGATVNDETVPDISLGIAWGKEWELKGHDHDLGPRTKYEHNYPGYFRQARSNPQWVWCYPEEALGAFRRWMRNVYLPNFYPQYLTRKEKKGDIPAIVVQAALKAVEVSRPKPLR
ncbi:Bro-N domain-containing protein [Methylobacterium sp. E-066]|uniref:BRO-N domain-containing protein n=1 Tax=Methylobacterium sp. E-066 TaxID=2836584 RepID=UPI001FB8DE90|nr:BRO family protein [Methylobacterium sp. E-066]MCJ2140272.1 hypothetical protein [Methylobacterium sp. E-066]